MPDEAQFWSGWVRAAMEGLDPVRVENPALPGTPDVNYVEGWVELKSIHKWPVRSETPVRCEHFTPEQRVWLVRRCRAGGRAHLLVRVGQDILLFDGVTAALHFGKVNKSRLLELAVKVWRQGRGFKEEFRVALNATKPK
jgi:hypothetical protein